MIYFVALGLAVPTATSSMQQCPVSASQFRWRGEIADIPLKLTSPLVPLPRLHGRARRLDLPAPKAPFPSAIFLPLGQGGGMLTLLARRRDGWLVGTDGGEWIGALYFVGAKRRVVLAKGNVLGGFTWRDRFYVLTGLAHLGIDEGEVWEVDASALRLVRRVRLPAKPEYAMLTDKHGVILRTRCGDVALLSNGEVVPGN